MIQLQSLTGMRPGEVVIMRGCDLDTTGKIWTYGPARHKTEHHGIARLVYVGPQAQGVRRPCRIICTQTPLRYCTPRARAAWTTLSIAMAYAA